MGLSVEMRCDACPEQRREEIPVRVEADGGEKGPGRAIHTLPALPDDWRLIDFGDGDTFLACGDACEEKLKTRWQKAQKS